jgi:hypothetical protein
MTPATAVRNPHARATKRRAPTRPPRRVSGPARGGRAPTPVAAVAVPPPLALRLAHAGGRIVDARFLDRLLRGRVWIALLALGLMGIVFIQVSMLRLNAGISRAITSAETLHRQNATLRADISKLDSSERIADAAASFGMIQPAAGSVTYLDARKANGAAAARGIHPPKPPKTAATTATTTATAAAHTTTTAPTMTAPAQTTTPAPTTTAPAPTATQPTTTTPATTATEPTATAPAPVQQTQTQAVTPAAGVAATATGTGGQ